MGKGRRVTPHVDGEDKRLAVLAPVLFVVPHDLNVTFVQVSNAAQPSFAQIAEFLQVFKVVVGRPSLHIDACLYPDRNSLREELLLHEESGRHLVDKCPPEEFVKDGTFVHGGPCGSGRKPEHIGGVPRFGPEQLP